MGYLIGSLSPSAFIAKLKKDDLRKRGTGNLGATNVTMIYGRLMGVLVMIFDISKSFAVFKIAELIAPEVISNDVPIMGLVASSAAVVGHIFPFYMKFKGGKGVATLGGMVLAYDPLVFLLLLVFGMLLMLIFNYGFMLTCSGGVLFCIVTTWQTHSWTTAIATGIVAGLVIWKHIPNIKNAGTTKEIRARDYIKKHIFKK